MIYYLKRQNLELQLEYSLAYLITFILVPLQLEKSISVWDLGREYLKFVDILLCSKIC